MSGSNEVEVKVRVEDLSEVERKLPSLGFKLVTPRTHEMNTLYDLPGHPLRERGELLRIRKYGEKWKLTHKSKGIEGRHKNRRELETAVADGEELAAILAALGFLATFRYEKFRTEWSDGAGHVVLDETPIGSLIEIEGPPEWIDSVASQLGIAHEQYITDSYAALFFAWKHATSSPASEMTFEAVAAHLPPK